MPFLPSDLTNLHTWLAADDSSTLFSDDLATVAAGDGDNVAVWQDKSGGGNHYTQTTSSRRPVVDADGVNSRQTVDFQGSDWMNGGQDATRNRSEIFVAAVIAPQVDTGQTNRIIWNSTVDTSTSFRVSFNFRGGGEDLTFGGRRIASDSYQRAEKTDAMTTDTEGQVRCAIGTIDYATGAIALRLDGLDVATGTIASTGTTADADSNGTDSIGGRDASANEWLDMHLCELVICTTIPTDAEIAQLEDYFADRWNVGFYHGLGDGSGTSQDDGREILDLSDSYAIMGVGGDTVNGGGIATFNISDLTAPSFDSEITDSGNLEFVRGLGVMADGVTVIASSRNSGYLHKLNYTDPTSPTVTGSFNNADFIGARGLVVSGDYAYCGCGDGTSTNNSGNSSLNIFDITGSNPSRVGRIDQGDNANVDAIGSVLLDPDGVHLYASGYGAGANSLVVYDISDPTAPTYVTKFTDVNLSGARGLALSGDTLFVASTAGYVFALDVSDPTSPTETGSVTGTAIAGARDVRLVSNTLYVSSRDGDGVGTVDVTTPASMSIAGRWVSPDLNGAYGMGCRVVGGTTYVFAASSETGDFAVIDAGAITTGGLQIVTLGGEGLSIQSVSGESVSVIGSNITVQGP